MNELDKAKEIFLFAEDVDPEDYQENKQILLEWEKSIRQNTAYLQWKDHPISQEINKLVKEAYKDFALTLAERRDLSDDQRMALWAKQDACLFILSLTNKDAKSELDSILKDIRRSISVT